MNLAVLIFNEIRFHSVNFWISVLSLGIVVCLLLLSSSFVYSQYQDGIIAIAAKENETKSLMNGMVNDYETITDRMGYTLRILSQKQSLNDFYSDGFGGEYISENVIDTLMDAYSKEIRCALPILQLKSQWEPVKRAVLFSGVGEPISFVNYELPASIPKLSTGSIALGFELPTYPEAIKGSLVNIKSKQFTIASCESQRGSIDDIRVWMNLRDMQSAFSINSKISEIWVWPVLDTMNSISGLVSRIENSIKSCKVVCISAPSILQIKARETAVAVAKETIETEKKGHQRIFLKLQKYHHVFSIASIAACIIWISILVFQNISVRQEEVMILRVLGFPDSYVVKILGIRGFCLGFFGASIGLFIGFLLLAILHQKVGESVVFVLLKSYALCVISGLLGIFAGVVVNQADPMKVLNRGDQCV